MQLDSPSLMTEVHLVGAGRPPPAPSVAQQLSPLHDSLPSQANALFAQFPMHVSPEALAQHFSETPQCP
jgi:hypothetical protein